jgi:hypothetical protein
MLAASQYRDLPATAHFETNCLNSLFRSLMELSPSGEAANCAVIQERPSILRNPKVHYCNPQMVSIPSQLNPIHTIPSYLSKIRWVPCHHGMVRPQVADGGDGL